MSDEEKTKAKKRRRGNGEGSIYQSADGRWVGRITVGYDALGKRRRRAVYGWTKREVQEKLARLQSQKLEGTLGELCKLSVAAFLTRWLDDSARPTIRATTHANYKGVINNHIAPRIGGVPLAKLTPAHVQGLYAELERSGASTYTCQLAHAVMHRAFKQAVKWGMVPRNVCDAVDPPRVAKVDIHPLSPEQVTVLLAAANDSNLRWCETCESLACHDADGCTQCGHRKPTVGAPVRLEALYVLAVTSGMRLGELFALQWPNVDLGGGTVAVRHTLSELNGKQTLAEPKTAKSRRRVDLGVMAVNALHEHRKSMLAEGHGSVPWVFCNSRGGSLRRSHFHHQDFKPLLMRAGLPDIRFHDLRHTAATLLLSQGVHPRIVQERLGHSQIGVTMDTYSHVLPSMQREAAGKLDALLSAKLKMAASAG